MESIRRRRRAKGLTQKQLAEMIDVSESHVSQIESGKRKPSFGILLKLGEALDCTVQDLLFGEINPATRSDGGEDGFEEFKEIYKELTAENAASLKDFALFLVQLQRSQDGHK